MELVRRLLRERAELDVRFAEAMRPESYYQGLVALFLHRTHGADAGRKDGRV